MGWFRNDREDPEERDDTYRNSRWRRPYDYASGYAQQSPTTITGAVLAVAWVGFTLWTHQGTFSDVARPLMEALTFIALFLAHNIHARKTHREVSEALEEARAARSQVEVTKGDLTVNTEHTVNAADSAQQAAEAAARVEAMVAELKAKFDALHGAKK